LKLLLDNFSLSKASIPHPLKPTRWEAWESRLCTQLWRESSVEGLAVEASEQQMTEDSKVARTGWTSINQTVTAPDIRVFDSATGGLAREPQDTARRRVYWARVAAICIGLVLPVLLLEFGLRIVGKVYDGSFFTGDRVRGWGLRPGAQGWALSEANVYVRINSDGLRDREHTIQKPPATLRIAVLGDSYVEGMNVPLEQTLPAVLERQLSSYSPLGKRRVEVINFGVSGYGTAQELLTLREHVWKYDPDIVLLAFYTGNDFFNNYRALNPVDADQYPYFVYAGDSLAVDNSFLRSWKMSNAYNSFFNFRGEVQNRLRVFGAFMEVIRELKTKSAKENSDQNTASLGLRDLEEVIYTPPTDGPMSQAWRVTEGILLQMRNEVRSRGAEFWMATLANRPQLNPDSNKRRDFLKRLGTDTLFYPDRRLKAFAQQAEIPTVTLAPSMSAYAEAHHVFLNGGHNIPLGQGHWNENGYRLAGELIASELCSRSSKLSSSNASLPITSNEFVDNSITASAALSAGKDSQHADVVCRTGEFVSKAP
jgi:hypothetical protein